jgi:chromosome segregation ATPase
LEEYEFKYKLQLSEGVISSLKKRLEGNDGVMQSNNKKKVQLHTAIDGITETVESLNQTAQMLCEKHKQLQATIDGQTKTEGANNRTVQELREKHKQLQATIDVQTKTEGANNRTIQELREKQKQLQATIDGLKMTVEAVNQTFRVLCGQPQIVSTCKVKVNGLQSLRLSIKPTFGQIRWFIRPTLPLPSGLVSAYS